MRILAALALSCAPPSALASARSATSSRSLYSAPQRNRANDIEPSALPRCSAVDAFYGLGHAARRCSASAESGGFRLHTLPWPHQGPPHPHSSSSRRGADLKVLCLYNGCVGDRVVSHMRFTAISSSHVTSWKDPGPPAIHRHFIRHQSTQTRHINCYEHPAKSDITPRNWHLKTISRFSTYRCRAP